MIRSGPWKVALDEQGRVIPVRDLYDVNCLPGTPTETPAYPEWRRCLQIFRDTTTEEMTLVLVFSLAFSLAFIAGGAFVLSYLYCLLTRCA